MQEGQHAFDHAKYPREENTVPESGERESAPSSDVTGGFDFDAPSEEILDANGEKELTKKLLDETYAKYPELHPDSASNDARRNAPATAEELARTAEVEEMRKQVQSRGIVDKTRNWLRNLFK